jgi:hypothetical protein
MAEKLAYLLENDYLCNSITKKRTSNEKTLFIDIGKRGLLDDAGGRGEPAEGSGDGKGLHDTDHGG